MKINAHLTHSGKILLHYRSWLPLVRLPQIVGPLITFESPCDLCGAPEAFLGSAESPERCRTLVCVNCGLIYASPRPARSEVDVFNLQNPGDAGSLASAPFGLLDEKDLRLEERMALWASKFIERFTDVKGKRVLSLRCLSGALAASLRRKGADVCGIDPFDTNIRHARRERGLSDTLVVPMSGFHELDLPWDCQFDVIEGLSVHVLAHVMYPRRLLSRILDLLKPGGYLFLDEKDVLLPVLRFDDFVLDTGRAHQHQLTLQTTARYVRLVGFELLECQIDQERVSAFHHIRVVARKLSSEPAALTSPTVERNGQVGKEIVRQLHRLAWAAWLKRQRKSVSARSRRVLTQIPGLQQLWHGIRD
jgi:2-polyprenyl-3-methyl-5-hydroxy-6-metoxy-1,4-benzoquinol methylase